MTYRAQFTHETYLQYPPFNDDMDEDVRQREVRIVKTKKDHDCSAGDLFGMPANHSIHSGEYAFYEHAIVDGEWGQSWVCLECMDRFLTENLELTPENGDEE